MVQANRDRPTPEEEKIEAWEYWHQRCQKLETLLWQALRARHTEESWVKEASALLVKRDERNPDA